MYATNTNSTAVRRATITAANTPRTAMFTRCEMKSIKYQTTPCFDSKMAGTLAKIPENTVCIHNFEAERLASMLQCKEADWEKTGDLKQY